MTLSSENRDVNWHLSNLLDPMKHHSSVTEAISRILTSFISIMFHLPLSPHTDYKIRILEEKLERWCSVWSLPTSVGWTWPSLTINHCASDTVTFSLVLKHPRLSASSGPLFIHSFICFKLKDNCFTVDFFMDVSSVWSFLIFFPCQRLFVLLAILLFVFLA